MYLLRTLLVFIFALTGLLAGAGPAYALNITSQRAIYSFSLAKARSNVAIASVSGQLVYNLKKVCGGWIQAQRSVMHTQLNTGNVQTLAMQFSSWESDDGTRYQFSTTSKGLSNKVLLGTAEVHPDKSGRATFSLPKAAQFNLPANTLFPMMETTRMIQAAQAGKKQMHSLVFEGMKRAGAKLLVVFISPLPAQAKSIMARLGDNLRKRPGWNFRMAYFDPTAQSEKPLYEVEVDMLDNGVTLQWGLDYGDYVVDMTLRKFKAIPNPNCS